MAEEIEDENFNRVLKEIEDEENEAASPDKKGENKPPVEVGENGNAAESNEAKGEVEEKKEKALNPDAEYYPHIGIMEGEGLKLKDLPNDIQGMVKTFRAKKNGADSFGGKESTYLKLRNLSAVIGDRIMDFLEKDLPERKDDGGEAAESEEVNKVIEADEGGTGDIVEKAEELEENEVIEPEIDEELEENEEIEEIKEDGDSEIDSKDGKSEKGGGMFGGVLGGVLDW